MSRLATMLLVVAFARIAISQTVPASDPVAVSLAVKAVAAMSGGNVINDVTLSGNAISILGSDYETGTVMLRALGLSQSRMDLNLNGWSRSDVRNVQNGTPTGAWQKNGGTVVSYSNHNCLTSAAWFFPALSVVSQSANTRFVFKYVGLEQHGGVSAQHLQVIQWSANSLWQHLGMTDVYLDATSFLPVAIAYRVHPDLDAGFDIASEVRFANYQAVNGVQVPFHIQQLLNGGVILDLTITNAVFNSGLSAATFVLQ